MPIGWKTVFSNRSPTVENPIPLSFRHPMSPGFCTWGTCWTIRYKTFWYAGLAWKGKMLVGFPAQTMHLSPPKPKWYINLQRKVLKKAIFPEKNFSNTLGNGKKNTAESSWNNSKNWEHPAIGTALLSLWTKSAPKVFWKYLSTYTTKDSFTEESAW